MREPEVGDLVQHKTRKLQGFVTNKLYTNDQQIFIDIRDVSGITFFDGCSANSWEVIKTREELEKEIKTREVTYGQIISEFKRQFPGLAVSDIRPHTSPNSIYVWVKNSPINLIARYFPESNRFNVITTNEIKVMPNPSVPEKSASDLENALLILKNEFLDFAVQYPSNEAHYAMAMAATAVTNTLNKIKKK